MKQFKTNLLYIFNKDDFFNCSFKTLHIWCSITNYLIGSAELFNEYLSQVTF